MSLLPKVLDKKKTLSEKDADKMPQLQCQSILPPPINIEGRDVN
jgi:hypothetical protein